MQQTVPTTKTWDAQRSSGMSYMSNAKSWMIFFFKGRDHKQVQSTTADYRCQHNLGAGKQMDPRWRTEQAEEQGNYLMESLLVRTKKTLERLWNQEWGRLKRTGWNTPEGVIHQVPRSHNPSKQADTEPSALPSSQGKDMNKGVSEGGPPGKITTNSPLPASPSSAAGSPQPTFASQAGRPFFPLQEKGPTDTDSWKSLWESRIQQSGQ